MRKRILGREVSFSTFPRHRPYNPVLEIIIMPSYFANNRIFSITVMGKCWRINWTPKKTGEAE